MRWEKILKLPHYACGVITVFNMGDCAHILCVLRLEFKPRFPCLLSVSKNCPNDSAHPRYDFFVVSGTQKKQYLILIVDWYQIKSDKCISMI